MKKIHIIGIVVIVILFAVIISAISDSSTYATFSTAISHEGKSYHVVGKLNKEKDFIYNPEKNANIFGFYLVDTEGKDPRILKKQSKLLL
jgi:cytochrome c-type biogenesis protein CcmE